jgi:hypothetical protein
MKITSADQSATLKAFRHCALMAALLLNAVSTCVKL